MLLADWWPFCRLPWSWVAGAARRGAHRTVDPSAVGCSATGCPRRGVRRRLDQAWTHGRDRDEQDDAHETVASLLEDVHGGLVRPPARSMTWWTRFARGLTRTPRQLEGNRRGRDGVGCHPRTSTDHPARARDAPRRRAGGGGGRGCGRTVAGRRLSRDHGAGVPDPLTTSRTHRSNNRLGRGVEPGHADEPGRDAGDDRVRLARPWSQLHLRRQSHRRRSSRQSRPVRPCPRPATLCGPARPAPAGYWRAGPGRPRGSAWWRRCCHAR